jgi:hypothetical protein
VFVLSHRAVEGAGDIFLDQRDTDLAVGVYVQSLCASRELVTESR